MKARITILMLVAAVGGLAAGTVIAQEIQWHRLKAGEFAGKGWALAESTEGRFAVSMPAPFDDYTQESNDQVSKHGYFLRSATPDGIAIQALRAEYVDEAQATKNCLRMRDKNMPLYETKSRRIFEVNGHTAIEIVVTNDRLWMTMRVICLKTEGMILAVAAPLDKAARGQELAGKFFDSLRIRQY